MSKATPGNRPNILILSCDEMRHPLLGNIRGNGMNDDLKKVLSFANDVSDDNPWLHHFPAFKSLRDNAVVLRNHTIATSACTPSRTSIYTGQYGAQTGVKQTDGVFYQADDKQMPWLDPNGIPTLGDWFRTAGYSTHYFGKWHLSDPQHGSLLPWGFSDWELSAPEPHGSNPGNLGVYRDQQFADSAIKFFDTQAMVGKSNPWLTVVSLVNPHDIASNWPAMWQNGVMREFPDGPLTIPGVGARSLPAPNTAASPSGLHRDSRESGEVVQLNPDNFPQESFCLPRTYNEDLLKAGKPSCQYEYSYKMGMSLKSCMYNPQDTSYFDAAVLPFQLTDQPDEWLLKYGQFYSYLQYLMNLQLSRVLDRFYRSGLHKDTIVLFFSDHGEMGGGHGGMIEKWHNAYQETVHVPMVFSSPLLNNSDKIREINQLTSHIDLAPTLLGLAGFQGVEVENIRRNIQNHDAKPLVGADLSDLIRDPEPQGKAVTESWGEEREAVLFVTDDMITAHGESSIDKERYSVFCNEIEKINQTDSLPYPLHPGSIMQPAHLQAVRSDQWKLVRYWDDPSKYPEGTEVASDQWELYNLNEDPTESINLLNWDNGDPVISEERLVAMNSGSDQVLTLKDVEEELLRLRFLLKKYVKNMGVGNCQETNPLAQIYTVQGEDNSEVDPANIQKAIDQACLQPGGVVNLIGTFDLGSTNNCITISGSVTVTGHADPSIEKPELTELTVIKSAGTAGLVIADSGDESADITVQKIWFKGGQTVPILFKQVTGTVKMIDNRVSGVLPGKEFRFAMAGARIGGANQEVGDVGELTGNMHLISNYIDNDVPFEVGDDNGFAFAGIDLKRIEVIDNFIRAAEGVEIEGCRGVDAVYIIRGNTVVQTPVVSNLAQLTSSPELSRHAGHPAAIKPIDVQAKRVVIENNKIDSREACPTAVGIMTGNSNAESETIIRNNHCVMNHQFAGILGGWAGTPGFFNSFYMINSKIENNEFSGDSLFGIACLDFNFLENEGMSMDNCANNNTISNNDFSDLTWKRSAIYLGPHTHDNILTGNFSESDKSSLGKFVDNEGSNNVIDLDR